MIVRGCQIAANPIRFVAVDREFRFLAAVAGSDQVSLWQCDGFSKLPPHSKNPVLTRL